MVNVFNHYDSKDVQINKQKSFVRKLERRIGNFYAFIVLNSIALMIFLTLFFMFVYTQGTTFDISLSVVILSLYAFVISRDSYRLNKHRILYSKEGKILERLEESDEERTKRLRKSKINNIKNAIKKSENT